MPLGNVASTAHAATHESGGYDPITGFVSQVTDGTTTVSPVTEILFASGATVTDDGGGTAQVDISGGGGGGSPLTVTDGTNTVTDVTTIQVFSSSAVVSDGGGGTADVFLGSGIGGADQYTGSSSGTTNLTFSGSAGAVENVTFASDGSFTINNSGVYAVTATITLSFSFVGKLYWGFNEPAGDVYMSGFLDSTASVSDVKTSSLVGPFNSGASLGAPEVLVDAVTGTTVTASSAALTITVTRIA